MVNAVRAMKCTGMKSRRLLCAFFFGDSGLNKFLPESSRLLLPKNVVSSLDLLAPLLSFIASWSRVTTKLLNFNPN